MYAEPGKAVNSLKNVEEEEEELEVCRLDSSGLWYGPVACYCKHGNYPSGSIKV
jgi:hypothetical protein